MQQTPLGPQRWWALGKAGLFWVVYLTILVGASMLKGGVPPQWGQLVWGATSAAAVLGLTLLFVRREGRNAREIGARFGRRSGTRFWAGLLLGGAVYGLNILVVSVLAGPVRFAPVGGDVAGRLLLAVATFCALSSMEELGFRGYPLRTLVPGFGLWGAQSIVVAGFALSHLAFGWSWPTIVFGVVPNAVLFGVAALASRGLAFPIGVHAGINIARWAAGETDTAGLWTIIVEEQVRGQVTTMAPLVGVLIPLLVSVALWRWYRPRPEPVL